MLRGIYVRVISVTILLIIVCTSCNSKDIDSSNLTCKEMYFQGIDETIAISYSDGFGYSYYYNLDSEYELVFELVLMEEDRVIDKVELKDIKKDIGYIDGTFGFSVSRDEENGTLVWTLRHDERTKSIISTNFFESVNGDHGIFSDGGIISLEGTTILFNEYDIDTNVDEDGNRQYEWSVKLRIYGNKIKKEVDN